MELGTCPVCNGTKRVTVPAHQQAYKHVYSGYEPESDPLPCHNCGAQYMYGTSSGQVRLNKDGVPCIHRYTSRTVGRCLTQYTCTECGDSYQIDSGD